MKFLTWIKEQFFEAKEIVLTGETPITITDVVWRDLVPINIGKRLDVSTGHIDYDYDTGDIDFDDSANVTNNSHALTQAYQLNHDVYRGAGAVIRPHVHFINEDINNAPRWKVQYMIKGRGDYDGVDWTTMDDTNFVYNINNTVNGKEEIVSLGDIPIAGVPLSAQIKVRLWRDGANDNAPTKVAVSFVDAHAPFYVLGSKEEFVQ